MFCSVCGRAGGEHWDRLPREWESHSSSWEYLKAVEMWHFGTGFSARLDSAGLMVGFDVFYKLNDSMVL